MSIRPRLKAHARPLRRSASAVQFGLCAELGLVLEGLAEAEVALLGRLDGSLGVPELYAVAAGLGVPRRRVGLLLDRLQAARLLVEDPADRAELAVAHAAAPEGAQRRLRASAEALAAAYGLGDDGFRQLAARAGQHVAVCGIGRLPEVIAALLREGGVGRVDGGQEAAAVEHALVEGGSGAPGLVVLTACSALASRDGATWQQHGVPQLPVVTQGHRVLIGPLVRPGGGACLCCLDLHRRDRDAAWPTLMNQLVPVAPGTAPAVEAETALGSTAAGLTAMLAHAHLDGLQVPAGWSMEVSLPWPDVVHRSWAPHPGCSCGAAIR